MASSLYEKYRPKNLPLVYTYRAFKWEQFFVGIFGALAIFGVLLKLWEPAPFWGLLTQEQGDLLFQIMMPIGFLGEVVVFIIMGFLKGDAVIEVYPDEMEDEEEEGESDLPQLDGGMVVNMELPESLKEVIEEKVSQRLDDKVNDLSNLLVEDVEKTRGLLSETSEINSKMQEIAESLSEFSDKVKTAGQSLDQFENIDTGNISENASSISSRLESAGSELNNFEEEMKKLSERFKQFNSPAN